jgi:hypothetical protein
VLDGQDNAPPATGTNVSFIGSEDLQFSIKLTAFPPLELQSSWPPPSVPRSAGPLVATQPRPHTTQAVFLQAPVAQLQEAEEGPITPADVSCSQLAGEPELQEQAGETDASHGDLFTGTLSRMYATEGGRLRTVPELEAARRGSAESSEYCTMQAHPTILDSIDVVSHSLAGNAAVQPSLERPRWLRS